MRRDLIFLFSGQGSQFFHMGSDLFREHGTFRSALESAEETFRRVDGGSLLEVLFDDQRSARDPFNDTRFTHPALVAVEVGLARVLREAGVEPDAVLGYSVGEIAAAVVGEVVTLEEGVALAIRQARLLEGLCDTGGMLAVLASPSMFDERPDLFGECELAALNFDRHFVVAGDPGSLQVLRAALIDLEIPAQLLPVKQAFHSSFMEPAASALRNLVNGIRVQAPTVPTLSATLAGRMAPFSGAFLWRLARLPVRFDEAIDSLEMSGPKVYVDLGPSATLANFLRYKLGDESQSVVLAGLRRGGRETQRMTELIEQLQETTATERRKEKKSMKKAQVAFRMEHSVEVETSRENAFNLVNAVDDWPDIFPPCKAARVVEHDGDWRTIEVTAQVGDEVRTWRSRRRLDIEAQKVEFEQENPFPPIDSMAGYWQVTGTDEISRIILVHEFETSREAAQAADPPLDLESAETWIRTICDNNSEKELKAFKEACEQRVFAAATA